MLAFSESRLATTEPAVPAPTTMKSHSVAVRLETELCTAARACHGSKETKRANPGRLIADMGTEVDARLILTFRCP